MTEGHLALKGRLAGPGVEGPRITAEALHNGGSHL
jgi:hypothetical protein